MTDNPAIPAGEAPSHRYYSSVEGRWRCAFELTIRDVARFRAVDMGFMNRLRILSLLWIQRLLGPLVMETSVDYQTAGTKGEVLHTLKLTKWHITVFASEEMLILDANGNDLTLHGRQWLPPLFWVARAFGPGHAQVGSDARSARYEFPWFGTTMHQYATIDDDNHLSIVQETEWSRGVQRLERQTGSNPRS